MTTILMILTIAIVGYVVYLLAMALLKSILSSVEAIRKAIQERAGKVAKISPQQIFLNISAQPKSTLARTVRILSAILLFLFLLILLGSSNFIFALLGGVFGFFLPVKIVQALNRKKFNKFEDQLIDALGMIAGSLRAGSSLLQALEILGRDAEEPLKAEINEVLRQVHLGTPLDTALWAMTSRVPSRDLHLAVLAINVTREFGGNLGENLQRIAATMRERRKIQGKINAITAQGRLSGWIVTAVPFLLLIVMNMMEPEMFSVMFTSILGKILLAIAIVMVTIGNIVIQKIVNIDI